MNKKKVLGLSILSGVLLGACWFPQFTFLIFIALLPLLTLTEEATQKSKRPAGTVFLFSYITFVVWNVIATWWTWFASPGGAIAAILANALLMAFTYWIYFLLSSKLKTLNSKLFTSNFKLQTVWLLIPVWLSFEYLHTIWELAWTWLTLGNSFAYRHNWVQWYEFTGVSGGSLWILALNILFFQLIQIKNEAEKNKARKKSFVIVTVLAIPVILSYGLKFTTNPSADKEQKIVIVQPNIDPYNEKFNGNYQKQLQDVFNQVKNKITDKTNYLVLPETFFTETVWENNMEESYSVKFLRDSLLKNIRT